MPKKSEARKDDDPFLQNTKALLKLYPNGVLVSTFWNYYKYRYSELPDHTKFGLEKRSDLFELLGNNVQFIGNQGSKRIFIAGAAAGGVAKAQKSPNPAKPKAKPKSKSTSEQADCADSLTFGFDLEALSLGEAGSTGSQPLHQQATHQQPRIRQEKKPGGKSQQNHLLESIQRLIESTAETAAGDQPRQPPLPSPAPKSLLGSPAPRSVLPSPARLPSPAPAPAPAPKEHLDSGEDMAQRHHHYSGARPRDTPYPAYHASSMDSRDQSPSWDHTHGGRDSRDSRDSRDQRSNWDYKHGGRDRTHSGDYSNHGSRDRSHSGDRLRQQPPPPGDHPSPHQQPPPPGTVGGFPASEHFPVLGAQTNDIPAAAFASPVPVNQPMINAYGDPRGGRGNQHNFRPPHQQQHYPPQHQQQQQQQQRFQQRFQQQASPAPQHHQASPAPQHHQASPAATPQKSQPQKSRHTKFVDKEQLEAVALDRMECLAEAKELVTVDRVERLILQHYEVESVGAINNMRKIEQIQCVYEMIRKQSKVNAYIQGFTKVRAVATLHELHEAVKAYCCEDGADFESLHLGPFVKQPLVYDFFQPPQDMEEIPEIDTDDVLQYLRDYLTKNNLWTNQGQKVQDLVEFIMEVRGVDNPYVLGIRIRSMPLLIGVLKRAQRDMGNAVRSALGGARETISSDLRNAAHLLVDTITERELGHCALRRKFLTKNFKTVVGEFFQKGTVLLDAVIKVEEQCGTSVNTRRNLHQHRIVFQAFVTAMRKDEIFTALLHIAMCCHQEEIHRQIADVMGWVKDDVVEISSEDSSDEDSDDDSDVQVMSSQQAKQKPSKTPKVTRKRPPLNELIDAAKKYLERCIVHGSLSLKNLARIESKLVEDHKGFPNFPEFGQGTFLDFILENDSIKKMLEESGGGSLLGQSAATASGGAYHPDISDITDFVVQCNIKDTAQVHLLEAALCQQYGVQDVRALGHGTALALLQKAQKQTTSRTQQPQHHRHQQHVLYEGALCARGGGGGGASVSSSSRQRQVGVLGPQSKEHALSCLQNCPLLEDMADWTHWELVFQPEMGALKDFVLRNGGVHNLTVTPAPGQPAMTYGSSVLALQTAPGTLLKLTCDASADRLARAAAAGDVRATCGQLASLVAVSGGLDNTPTALLANHVKTALLTMQAGTQEDHVPGAPPTSSSTGSTAGIVTFILECLATLPLGLCHGLANQVFLDPLTAVVGSAKSKELLLHHAAAAASPPRLKSRLQTLGFLLGVGDWAKSFQNRMELARTCLKQPESLDMGGKGGVIEERYVDVDEKDMEVDPAMQLLDSDDDLLLSDTDEEEEEEEEETEEEEKSVLPLHPEVKQDGSVISLDTSVTDGTITLTDDDSAMEADAATEEKEEEEDGEKKEGEEAEEEEEKDPCEVIVDTIRREEFGVDVQLSEDGARLMLKQQERLGRSLDRLSKDLYSKDTHFVLELIQNADDNDYPEEVLSGDGSSAPSVKFLVTKESIQVLNNENGFTERNIRAICDVGRSTKGKHKYGYIGQKGIGFKSVFRVTDCPEVHSNGFHIKFDVNSGPAGYILPHWVAHDPAARNSNDKWKTRIVLPLKSELQQPAAGAAAAGAGGGGTAQSLTARFHDVHPSLLLFLHRLRNLTVVNKAEDYTLKMQRRDLGKHVVEIRHQPGGNVDRWLMVRQTLDAAHISLQAKSGVEVEATEMALAFPLHFVKADGVVVADKQPVFAFLPLRTYGFRFIVQADFDVPSSREDVDRDSMWNQWLLSEIHHVFLNALQVFKEHAEFDTAVHAVCNFLQFIPLEDEILDFFRPVASNILQQLRAKPCLPTEPGKDAVIQWKLPSQLVLTRDPLIKAVVSAEVLQSQLSLDYLHSAVAATMSPALMRALDIQALRTEHLLQVGQTLLGGFEDKDDDEMEELSFLITQWLACVYRSLDDLDAGADAILEQLRAMPIIPLAGGRMVRLTEATVFFPLDRSGGEGREGAATGKRKKDPMYYLEQDLDTVQLLLTDDAVVNSQVERMLEQLGVKRLTPQQITQHHIVPTLQDDLKWKSKSRDVLLSYVVFLKEQYSQESLSVSMDELRPLLVLWTNHGLKKPAEDAVHFTPAYRNPIDLHTEFPGYEWTLVDAVYLQGSSMAHVAQQWRDFLQEAGVLDFLATENTTVTLTPDQLAAEPLWSSHASFLPPLTEHVVIKDCTCPQLTALIEHNSQPARLPQQMTALFQRLSVEWEARYLPCTRGTMLSAQEQVLGEVETSFAAALKRSEWLPAVEHRVSEKSRLGDVPDITQSKTLRRGADLFLRLTPITQFLAVYVPYLGMDNVAAPCALADFLGITASISVDFVRDQLVRWSQGSAERPGVASMTLNHVTLLYTYLADNLPPKQLQDLLTDHAVIFTLPEDCVVNNPNEFRTGQFKGRNDVRWNDPTQLFSKHQTLFASQDMEEKVKQPIIELYPSLQQMFVHTGRIQLEPSLDDLVDLLLLVTSAIPLPAALPDTLRILGLLGQGLLYPNCAAADGGPEAEQQRIRITARLANAPVIPLKASRWARASEQPMIADDKQLEKLFTDKVGVLFVDLGERLSKNRGGNYSDPAPDPAPVRAFLERELGVCPVSACLEVRSSTESYRPCPQLQRYFRDVVPYVQRLLYTDYHNVYTEWTAAGLAAKIQSMLFGQVGKLEVVQSLTHLPQAVVVSNNVCQLRDDEFNVHHDKVTSFHDLNREVARYFSRGDTSCFKEIRSLLLEMLDLIKNPSAELDKLVRDYQLLTLPATEECWTVKEPVVYEPPPPPPPPPPQTLTPPVERMQVDQPPASSSGGGGGERAGVWPPRAPADYNASGGMRGRAEGSVSGDRQWPAPAPPPGSVQHMSSLPPNLRPSNIPRQHSRDPDYESDDGPRLTSSSALSIHGDLPSRLQQQTSSSEHPSSGHHNTPSGGVSEAADGGGGGGGGGSRPPRASSPAGSEYASSEMEYVTSTQQRGDVTVTTAMDGRTTEHGPRMDREENATHRLRDQEQEGREDGEDDEVEGDSMQQQKQQHRLTSSAMSANKRPRIDSDVDYSSPRRPVIFHGEPVWSQTSDESVFQEVSVTGRELAVPKEVCEQELDADDASAVGRWGEQFVYSYYMEESKQLASPIVGVTWLNEGAEKELPYDLMVTLKTEHRADGSAVLLDGDDIAGIRTIFIEVKATLAERKAFFEISYPQLKFAEEKEEDYHVIRVYNVGKAEKVKVMRLENLVLKMREQKVKVCMVI